jgi:hypothetical protein
MSQTILIKKQWTPKTFLQSQVTGGKKKGRVAGGWIADLAASKRVITLCQPCTPKFNPGRVGYRKEKEFPTCQAICDGCSVWSPLCSMYIYGELYTTVRPTVDERRALMKSREQRIKRGYL